MISIELANVSDDVLDILQMIAHDQINALQEQCMMITAEKVKRRGGVNQMTFDYEVNSDEV